jgi:hypothetical protein
MYKRIPPTVVPAKAGIHKTRRPILIPEIRFKHNLQGLGFEPDRQLSFEGNPSVEG